MRPILFLWGVLSLGYAPGALLLHVLKRSLTPLEHVSLSLTFGLVMSAVAYWLIAVTGYPALFVAWPVGAVALLLYVRRRDLSTFRLGFEKSHAPLVAVLALGVIVLIKVPLFFGNLTVGTDGGMTVVPISDALLHVAIANELTHSIPPQNPVFAGQALSYHYGMDLVTAMMARGTGLSVADLTVRFVPMLLVVGGMLTVFCFSRRWLGGSNGFAALTALLVFLGEDFSFVPGLMHGWDFDWTTAFNVPTVFSLFYVNPMLPAVGLLFAGLFCLQKYLDAPDYAWLALSAVCFAALSDVKVFTAAHLLGSLGATALVYVVIDRRFELLKVAVVTTALTAPFLLNTILKNQAGANIEVIFGSAGYVDGAMQRIGLLVTGVPAFLAVGLPLFLIASFGLRLVGGWAIVKTMFRPAASGPLRFMLAFFVVAGVVLTLTVRIVAKGHGYDNGVWFCVQSKFVAWIFAVEVLRRWYDRLRSLNWAPALAGALIAIPAVALAVPSTVQHFVVMSREAAASDPAATDAARFVASKARPGDVVLVNQAVMARVLAFAPVRLPVGYWAETLVSRDRYEQREALVLDFWRAWESGISRTDIPRYLGVRYVSAVKHADLHLPSDVKEVYSNADYVVLELPIAK